MAMTYEQAKAEAARTGGQVSYINGQWSVVGAQQAASAGTLGPTGGGDASYWTGLTPGQYGTSGGSSSPYASPPPMVQNPFAGATARGGVGPIAGDENAIQEILDLMGGTNVNQGAMAPDVGGGFPDPYKGSQVIPGLFLMPDGSYIDVDGFAVSPDLAKRLIDDFMGPGAGGGGAGGAFPTEPPPMGYQWVWDASSSQYVLEPGGGVDPFAQQGLDLQREQLEAQMAYWQQQSTLDRDRMAQEAALYKAQETARLAAQPISWLQYAQYTGETPAVQPWMLPLSSGDYPQLQAGQAIPGYQQGNMTGMPDLLRPSAQYYSRMGPTNQQQYLGYQQADQGAMPQETMWRQEQYAPPGGRFAGLSRRR